jgi:hypothetical protein
MNSCPKCSSPINDPDLVCSQCGYSLPAAPTQIKTNGFAIASMVLGIVSIPLLCCCYIGAVPAIIAIIFGFIARNKIKEAFGSQKGEGMALAGIITGFSTLGLIILLLVFSLSGVFSTNSFWEEFQRQLKENMNKYQS